MDYKKVLLGLSMLCPFASMAKADPDTFSGVEILPLKKQEVLNSAK